MSDNSGGWVMCPVCHVNTLFEKHTSACRIGNLERALSRYEQAELPEEPDRLADMRAKVAQHNFNDATLYHEVAEAWKRILDYIDALRAHAARVTVEIKRSQAECDAITELNHKQYLELEYLRPIELAANELLCESEEYDFDDGLGKGAPQDLWDALSAALERKPAEQTDEGL